MESLQGAIEAIKEVPNMLQTELVNQELRAIVEKEEEIIKDMDGKLFKANLELVYFSIVFYKHTLKSALDERNIPMEDRGVFVRELLLKYPGLLEDVVAIVKCAKNEDSHD